MPSGFQNFDRFAWARSLHTTMPKLLREVEDTAKKNFQIMALLEAAGRISVGHGGEGIQWPVRYKNHKAVGATGENSRNFTPTNLFKSASLDFRGYEVTDSIKRREMEKNKGESAIIKVLDGFAERLKESLLQELAPQFYIDGEDPENERFWHGFKTLSRTNSETINNDGSGARAKNAADKVAAPSGTYANLSCVLGNYGGAQDSSAPWPEATQDANFDFWSPLVVNRDSSGFAGSGGAQLEKAIRYGITHAQRNSTIDGQITNVFMDRNLFIDLKDNNDGRQTIEVKNAPGSLVELGFRNVFKFDGIELGFENAVPSGYAFGINLACMELMGLTSGGLFEDEGGPQYDINTQSMNAVVSTLSNIKYKSPRNFVVWKPLSEI
tara:strand:+ start:2440 stop:3585 length:1146 start_codon:yes stop_codon:yes gene_type:complete